MNPVRSFVAYISQVMPADDGEPRYEIAVHDLADPTSIALTGILRSPDAGAVAAWASTINCTLSKELIPGLAYDLRSAGVERRAQPWM